MKKIMVLLMIMAIAMGSVFAAEGQWGGSSIPSDGSAAATLEVTLKLDGEDMFNIGFASEEVTADNINSEAFEPLKSLKLEIDGNEYQGKAYVYYGIKAASDSKYDISLTIDKALTTSIDTDGIDWGITSGEFKIDSVDDGETASDAQNTGAIFANVGSADNAFTVKSKELAISTIGFLEDTDLDETQEYSATVTLKISTGA